MPAPREWPVGEKDASCGVIPPDHASWYMGVAPPPHGVIAAPGVAPPVNIPGIPGIIPKWLGISMPSLHFSASSIRSKNPVPHLGS